MLDSFYKRNKQHTGEQLNFCGVQECYLSRATKETIHLVGASYQSAILACLESKYEGQARRVMTVEKATLQVGRKPAIQANQAEILVDPHRNHSGTVGQSLHPTHSQIHAKTTFLSPFPQWRFWPLLEMS